MSHPLARANRRVTSTWLLPLAAMAGFAASAGHAETVPDPDPTAKDGDVVVTGRHEKNFRNDSAQLGAFRNQSLLDTPMTVTIINRTLLDAQNAQGVDDALRNIAGVTLQGTSPLASTSFASRGILANARTNFRLNGTQPILNYLPFPLEDKERVEALKGVSALYYGFTTPSVLVNLVTKRAGPAPITVVSANTDADGTYGGGIDVGRTFGPDHMFGVRVNAYGAHLGTPVDGVSGYRWLLSGAFDARLTDTLSTQLDVEHFARKVDEPGSILLPSAVGAVAGIGGTITLPPLQSGANHYAPQGASYGGRTTNVLARINYAFADGWSVHADGGVSRTDRERWVVDIGPINVTTGNGILTGTHNRGEGYENDGGRIEMNGRIATGFVTQDLLVGYSLNRLLETANTQQAFTGVQNLYNPVVVSEASLTLGATKASPRQRTYDKGGYVLDIVHLGDHVSLIGGLRDEHFEVDRDGSAIYRMSTTTPSAAVIVKPIDHVSLYATYIEGLESAGTAPTGTTNAGQTLNPLVSRQKEVGTKLEIGKALLTAAWFHIDRALAYTDSTNTYVADGRAVHRGAEFALQGALGAGFSTALSAQLLKATQERTAIAAQNGKSVTNAPRFAGSAFVEYRPPVFAALGVNAGLYYTGRRWGDLQERASLPGYTLVSLGTNYRFALADKRALTVRITADNVFDSTYWATAGDQHLYVGLPRTVRASASLAL